MTDGIAETTHIPEILRQARTAQGLDLAFLARKTGVARNHLADIEEGYAGSFHSLAYCRRAVMAYADALGVAEQVAKHWDDRAWRLDPNGARPAGIEASSTGLLPSLDGSLAARKWLMPAVGILGLILVGWLSLERLDQDPTEPTVTGASTSPAIQTPLASGATAPTSPVPSSAGGLPQTVTGPAAPPAAAPVTPPAAAPSAAAVASPAATFRIEVERAMAEWVRRWVARDIPGYVAFYAPDFVGAAQHLGIRRQRMAQAKFIKVSVVEPSYLETAPGEITVRFRQVYESDSYSSNDRKEIVWRQTPNGPKIRAERLVN